MGHKSSHDPMKVFLEIETGAKATDSDCIVLLPCRGLSIVLVADLHLWSPSLVVGKILGH